MLMANICRYSWNEDCRALILTVGTDLVLVSFNATFGLPGVSRLPLKVAVSIPILSLCAVFLVKDLVKAALLRKFWRQP